ncbi:aminodeoxychorismate synthase component I [Marinomonas agarivorans]|nr:aminodeoxychorismate synthase component I [Marinomonas agarivorans]
MSDLHIIDLPYVNELVTLYPYFRDLPAPALLDSNQPHFADSLCDILVADPLCRIHAFQHQNAKAHQPTTNAENYWQAVWRDTPLYDLPEPTNVFDYLQALLNAASKEAWARPAEETKQLEKQAENKLPFTGGLLGYFGYESGHFLETLPSTTNKDIDIPTLQVGLYGWALISLHQTRQTLLVMTPWCTTEEMNALTQRCQRAIQESQTRSHEAKAELLSQEYSQGDSQEHSQSPSSFRLTAPFSANMSAEAYAQKFAQVQEYILAGDCYQVNLAQRFSAPYEGDTFTAYQSLRQHSPTPFAAYFELDDSNSLLSHSPERFIRVDYLQGQSSQQDKGRQQGLGMVETKPIKGTRARGKTQQEDDALAQALLESEKDRAENLMIVDLLRNDLGKTCVAGSIKVPTLFALESYANVHHLVSTVTGTIPTREQHFEVFRHSFPGGSITGAPKIRAMEIIDELEPDERSVYCGSIAYFSVNGQMDSSITIRTLVANAGKLHCWAGGGLVADSNCEDEYQETFTKIRNLTHTLERTL